MVTAATANPGADPKTTQLRLASGNGPITRTVLQTPLRDASPSEIPLIDISPVFSDSLGERQAVARKIHDAATNTGFFYIANHGVPSDVTDDACAACLDFFQQDLDTKMRAEAKNSPFLNGFRAPDKQRINPDEGTDAKEAFSVMYDPRIDSTTPRPEDIPEHVTKHMRSEDHPWETTANMPRFQEAAVRYFKACLVLARALTRAFALSLDLPEDTFDAKVQYPDCSIGLNYYPPMPASKTAAPNDPDARPSLGSHTDFQLFTILWQDSNGGLQILRRDGQWLNARPVQDTFVVNIADCLQRITNDKYVSTVHRVQNWSGRERVSMPFFWGFGLHESCGVLDSCVGPGEERKYEEIRCADWLNKRIAHMLDLDEDEDNGR
ncbi:1-aminocyclopropane-1-carboxylate oxidase [Tolypocladium ophioglossoides CBS 100239]|uniref:1-aminocyclopropane-1-carboxylate oxidase n=1 Tax=Tolypocladium ophioglossoides (strain CBS 100239) TaxID=1163406 RepID=A0A0L0N3T9_TOLOC|nr:1-aminocyclopropane-1-carboxylate oxidase [Tolypocladium ophioglossoides CBS 100239]